jgi:hypothetical protein
VDCYYHDKVAKGFIDTTRSWSGLDVIPARLDPAVAARATRFQRDYFAQLLTIDVPTPAPRVRLGRYDLANICTVCGDPLPPTIRVRMRHVCEGCRSARRQETVNRTSTTGLNPLHAAGA